MSGQRPDGLELTRGKAPRIVGIPHAGVEPREYEPRFVSPWLARKDADWRLDELYDFAVPLDATLVRTRLSRSVVNVNRDPSGASLCAGQAPDANEIDTRRRAFFGSYYDALRAEIARLRARFARIALFDGPFETLLDAARALGFSDENRGKPARWKGRLDQLLPNPRTTEKPRGNYAAKPYEDVPALMAKLGQAEGVVAKALASTILAAVRSGELFRMTCDKAETSVESDVGARCRQARPRPRAGRQ
jgi:hypothetical protein